MSEDVNGLPPRALRLLNRYASQANSSKVIFYLYLSLICVNVYCHRLLLFPLNSGASGKSSRQLVSLQQFVCQYELCVVNNSHTSSIKSNQIKSIMQTGRHTARVSESIRAARVDVVGARTARRSDREFMDRDQTTLKFSLAPFLFA